MRRILFDQNVPRGLRKELGHHEVATAAERGWTNLSNGDLIEAAEGAGYDVLLTADQNLRYQQNLASRSLAVVVLGTNRWSSISAQKERVVQAIDAIGDGGFIELSFEPIARPLRRRDPRP